MSDIDDETYQNETSKLKVNATEDITNTAPLQDDSGENTKKKKVLMWSLIGGGILIAIILIVVLSVTLTKDSSNPIPVPPSPPIPEGINPLNYQEFNNYQAIEDDTLTYGNDYQQQTTLSNSANRIRGWMKLEDRLNGNTYKPVDPSEISNDVNNNVPDQVQLNFALIDNYQVNLNVTDPTLKEDSQYSVPRYAFERPVLSFEARFTQVGFIEAPSNEPYYFNFSNIYNGETLISSAKRKLLISDKYSEIGFILPNNRLFGLGQHNSQFQLSNGTYTLWSRGRQEGMPRDNQEGGLNGPHIHPFIMGQTANKDFYGIFFASSSAMAFEIIEYRGEENVVLNYIQAGGQMEIYFMMRGSAQEILNRYHKIIGFPQVPPYYALGFFQGSNSYTTLDAVKSVVDGYLGDTMALEGVLVDNYYAGPNQVFTVSDENFPSLVDYADTLATTNQHLILGLMSGVANTASNYQYYDDLISNTCVVMSTVVKGSPLVGNQQDTVVFPDYSCGADIESWFQTGLEDLHGLSHFSGLILQGNHYYTNVGGEVWDHNQRLMDEDVQVVNEETSGSWEGSYKINHDQSVISSYDIPFIGGFFWSGNPDNESISLNATHSFMQDGKQQVENELFVHNVNGHMNLKAVYNALVDPASTFYSGQRPFLFSDSTWLGSGHLGAVALTDMWRDWPSLRSTISMAMSLSMEGVSNIASDVCGSLGDMDEELCGRWAQLGAFMPLMRNYYSATKWDFEQEEAVDNAGSEFFNIEDYDFKFMTSSSLNQRIMYHRYIYSQLYKVYRYGGSIVSPLFFDFPEDDSCFTDIEHTYMLGEAVKVSPVLEAGVTDTFQSYFPSGKWADLNQWDLKVETTDGEYVDLNQSYAYTNIHLKEGKIIPFQSNPNQYKQTYDFLTKVPMEFVINRDASDYAEGFIIIDDGISVNSWDNIDFAFWKLRYAEKSINFWIDWGKFDYEVPEGYTIDTLGAIHIVDAEDLAGTNFACTLGLNLFPTELERSYNPYTRVLTLKPVAGSTLKFKDIGFVKFGNSFQEPNFCDYTQAFTYKIDSIDPDASNDQYLVMSASSLQGTSLLKQLAVTVRLMDDLGTISLNITTWEDYQASLNDDESIYKPKEVIDWTLFQEDQVTKRLDSFFTFSANPFSYQIFTENNPGNVLYESDPNKLYFEDYMIFDSGIFNLNQDNNKPLMGMGEDAGSLFYSKSGIYSRYTHDQANPIDDGLPPGKNMYGFQPLYLFQSEVADRWVGVFDLNPYATDYLLDFNDGVNTQITKVSIGGMIQKYFFFGDKPDDIIITYGKLSGFPIAPPLWAFGWQQCRFGYKDQEQWLEVVNEYQNNDLPLDTMWADIDYMDDYKIFTVSDSRYGDLGQYVKQLHDMHKTFVPIMDVGVAVRENDDYYTLDQGLEKGVFIMQYDNSAPLTAGVWCGHAYFPDFFNRDSKSYWHDQFDYLSSTYDLSFDGIWIDMNEATNFCTGYCIQSERPVDSLRNKPYYVPGWRDLEDQALGMDGLHPGAWNGKDLHEYDVHNMYSLAQVKATSSYLSEKLNLKPFVLSRSNFPGLQRYGSHWLADNWSTLEYLQLSIDAIYQYQLYGLPFMGSDICGFNGDAPATTCTRWHQMGSLYPFARNHNQNASISQEPYVFSEPYGDSGMTYTDIIRVALRNRYSLIKYFYAKFHDMSTFGGSFFKPLFFEFVSDATAYLDTEINILLGDALKISMQTGDADDQITTTSYYFPRGKWCQVIPFMTDASTDCFDLTDGGAHKDLPSTLLDYQLHLRAGYILPMQDASSVLQSYDLQALNTNFYLIPDTANTDKSTSLSSMNAAASGYIYYDDGVTLDVLPTRFDLYFTLGDETTPAVFTVNQVLSDYPAQDLKQEQIGTIMIMLASQSGLDTATTATVVHNDKQGTTADLVPTYDATTDILTIDAKDLLLSLYDLASIEIQ